MLLVLLGVGIALSTLDLNAFVAPVLARIKVVTGREVTVGGRVSLRIGFRPKVVAHDVRLANAPWAKAPYFVTAKELELQLALLPLLRRDFELVRLNIVEPVVALETSKDGKGNWELEPVAGAAGGPPPVDARPGAFAVGDLLVTDGVQEVRLAEADAAADEHRVVLGRVARRGRLRCGERELVRRTRDERVERVARVQRGRVGRDDAGLIVGHCHR